MNDEKNDKESNEWWKKMVKNLINDEKNNKMYDEWWKKNDKKVISFGYNGW